MNPVLPIPSQIIAHLDRYVRGQARAKQDIAVAVYNHYLSQTYREREGLGLGRQKRLKDAGHRREGGARPDRTTAPPADHGSVSRLWRITDCLRGGRRIPNRGTLRSPGWQRFFACIIAWVEPRVRLWITPASVARCRFGFWPQHAGSGPGT